MRRVTKSARALDDYRYQDPYQSGFRATHTVDMLVEMQTHPDTIYPSCDGDILVRPFTSRGHVGTNWFGGGDYFPYEW